ncbi:AAEL012382-PA [Aedes aegypti]|uniref:AAEL012382-PA n=1 Tax=Aedes aegypti TaxID=7159 RepID=Q16M88_AEDAE|nr:AAEL012382-PA [Aedes aegypti]
MIIRWALLLLAAASVQGAPRTGNFQLIILHNNDMHARFEQTGAYGNDCQPADVASNRCYGGFARVAHNYLG